MSWPFFWTSTQRQTVTRSTGIKHMCAVVLRRAAFLALFIFWSIKHRSTKHAAWIAAYEGYPWK